jgi:type II secretory pathway predicted ATPase ExeA
MDSRLVVSVVLSGQAPLAKLLSHPRLEDVARRLAHYATLRLLSRGEIKPYIEHRCHIAIDALYEIGRGNLRATDHLALKSLEIAHDCDCDVLDSNHITQAKRMLWK